MCSRSPCKDHVNNSCITLCLGGHGMTQIGGVYDAGSILLWPWRRIVSIVKSARREWADVRRERERVWLRCGTCSHGFGCCVCSYGCCSCVCQSIQSIHVDGDHHGDSRTYPSSVLVCFGDIKPAL